jgi:excisionase family DNA binding protein
MLPALYCSLTVMSNNSGPAIELLTIAEVAELLKVSVSSVRRLQQRRQIPFIKVGGSVRVTKSDLMSFLEKGRVEIID